MVREIDEDLIGYLIVGAAESLGYALMMDSRYTVQEGVELFLDFIGNGILRSGSEEPRNSDMRTVHWDVVDSEGNHMTVEDMTIGGETRIVGKDRRRRAVGSTSGCSFDRYTHECPRYHNVSVSMQTANEVTLRIDGDPILSGKVPLRTILHSFGKSIASHFG